MAGDTPITLIGNLTADPELRFTPSGHAVAKFTVASTPRVFDRQTNEWRDQDTLFLNCEVWRQYAENVTESLQKGMRVIVSGRLKSRSYETNSGEKRTVFEVDVEDVGPALRNATAKVTRTTTGSGGQGGGGGWSQGSGSGSGSSNRPASNEGGGGWGGNAGGGQPTARPADNDPWASAQSDEPPF
jgi:single-strand DNA-binding protein